MYVQIYRVVLGVKIAPLACLFHHATCFPRLYAVHLDSLFSFCLIYLCLCASLYSTSVAMKDITIFHLLPPSLQVTMRWCVRTCVCVRVCMGSRASACLRQYVTRSHQDVSIKSRLTCDVFLLSKERRLLNQQVMAGGICIHITQTVSIRPDP